MNFLKVEVFCGCKLNVFIYNVFIIWNNLSFKKI